MLTLRCSELLRETSPGALPHKALVKGTVDQTSKTMLVFLSQTQLTAPRLIFCIDLLPSMSSCPKIHLLRTKNIFHRPYENRKVSIKQTASIKSTSYTFPSLFSTNPILILYFSTNPNFTPKGSPTMNVAHGALLFRAKFQRARAASSLRLGLRKISSSFVSFLRLGDLMIVGLQRFLGNSAQ